MTIEAAFFGSLVRDAEVKTSKGGKAYLKANIRVENGEAASFINTMVFDAEAIASADKMAKGSRIYVEGKLSLDEWTAPDGSKRTGLSCMSFHTRLSQIGRNRPKRDQQQKLEPATSGRARAAGSMHAPLGNGAADMNDDIPF